MSQAPLQVEEQVEEQLLPHPLHAPSHDPVQLLSQAPQHPLQYWSILCIEKTGEVEMVNKHKKGNVFLAAFLKNSRLD